MLVAFGYGYGIHRMYFDWTYLLIIIGVLLSLAASSRVKSTFNRFSQVPTARGITGAQAAEQILRGAGIFDVAIVHISGQLTDNYNPGNKTLSLSDSTYYSNSVAAVGVAAHECDQYRNFALYFCGCFPSGHIACGIQCVKQSAADTFFHRDT